MEKNEKICPFVTGNVPCEKIRLICDNPECKQPVLCEFDEEAKTCLVRGHYKINQWAVLCDKCYQDFRKKQKGFA